MTRAAALPPLLCLALAAIVPLQNAQAADARLQSQLYDPSQVVVINGKTNVQATIAFETNELIENVAIGDAASWQVTPNKRANLLFVKPLSPKAATNMTVVTNLRTYLFDLVANPAAEPLYVLRFTYPQTAEKPAVIAQGPNALEQQAMEDPYAVQDPGQLNFAWGRAGDPALLPSRIHDDGEATFLSWPAGEPIPAILILNEDKIEGPVNYAVRGDTVVVDGVPGQIILRSGDGKAVLTHQAPERQVAAISNAQNTSPKALVQENN